MGKAIASRTHSIKLYNDKLVIQVTSAPLKQELNYSKNVLIEKINSELNEAYIKSVEIR